MEILLNQVGYDSSEPKRAVLKSSPKQGLPQATVRFRVLDASSEAAVLEGEAPFVGAVQRWKDWIFWRLEFSGLRRPGRYRLELSAGGRSGRSEAFEVGEGLLRRRTLPAVLSYFRSQRCSGALDQADRSAPFFGGRAGRVDVHGGWYDASGDKSKYLSHLSYANYLNPQQTPLVVWALLAARDLLAGEGSAEARQGLLEEALHGADFLRRMQDPAGYFYIGVFDRWSKDPAQREICAFRGQEGTRSDRYRAGYRQGGGLAVAALARASSAAPRAEASACLEAASRGFAHLEAHNREYLDDGEENILDDCCALLAAMELHRASGEAAFLQAARLRAERLSGRLHRDERYSGWWRADARGERPFFHASDAGLPVIALLRYVEAEPERGRAEAALKAVRRSLEFELAITGEIPNPFGYARQYVKPVDGPRRAAFFFPHRNESGYWWQGENARLASLAAAARLACRSLPAEAGLKARLQTYAADQLDWILGCNPFDACLLHGFGRNNPEYEESWPNAYGGICNGITGGFADEEDIDFLPLPQAERGEHRWRWSEQWLPHAAWYLLAVCAGEGKYPSPGGPQSL
jgi:hypothetical protein